MTPSGQKDEPPHLVGEVQPFDPGPSVDAACAALDALGADYALIGGLALDAWGIPRATKDADLAVRVGVAEPAAKLLEGPDVTIRPLRIGGIGVRGGGLRIDLIDRRFHFAQLYGEALDDARRRKVRVGSRELPIVSLEHLLAMKMVSGEPKDDADVRRILGLEGLDFGRARGIVQQHLGPASANRLDAFARDAGRPEVAPRRLYRNGDDAGEGE